MKKLLAGAAILWGLTASAQQRPHYTQYILNNYIINPAVAGIENYTDIKLSHRHQWVGIQDAPVTTYFTIHAPIGKKDDRTNITSYAMDGENPRGKSYWESYQSAAGHFGIGAQIINDRTGPLTRTSGYVTASYHKGLTATMSIAGGISFGITSNNLNTAKLDFGTIAVDPAVAGTGTLRKLKPDLQAGIWLYGADFFAGVSAQQILPQGLIFHNDTLKLGNAFPHMFGTFGVKFYASDDINIIPSVVLRYVDPLPFGVDINVKATYRDRLWLGGGYRFKDGVSAMAGININNTFNVGYAYDYTTSRLNAFSKGTHEIVLGFVLGNKYGDWCPRNMW